jgi:hypothetical protein
VGAINDLYERYKDKADFRVVYVREAHPDDGWQLPQNKRAGVVFNTPQTFAERLKIAEACGTGLMLKMPIVVDNMDDAVEAAYAGWPDRIYVIGKDGKVAFQGRPGPAGFKPAEAEEPLRRSIG